MAETTETGPAGDAEVEALVERVSRAIRSRLNLGSQITEDLARVALEAMPAPPARAATGAVEVKDAHHIDGLSCEFDDDCYTLTWPDGRWLTAKANGTLMSGKSPYQSDIPPIKTSLAALTAAPAPAVTEPAEEAAGSDFPMGAIENGRAFADRLEQTGLECPAGDLRMCSDWHEFRRCFEWLAAWALGAHPAPEEAARLRARVAKLEAALRPFARLMSDIPDDMPDDLWTTCSTYEYDMPEDQRLALVERGVFLKSGKTRLSLWIDGHSIGDFRRAREALSPQPGQSGKELAKDGEP